jgi:ligand-binding sensor domain-containing protein
MDKTQGFTLILVFMALTLTCLAVSPVQSEIRHWESFTSFNEVTDMTMYNGEIWVATKGGLVRIDPDAMTFETYTNVDGLGMNQIHSLYVDDQQRLWVGGRGRLVDFSDPSHPDGYLFTDRDGGLVEIYDIAGTPGGDSLWLANRLGVIIFLTSEDRGMGLILDTYTRLGDIDRDIPVLRVALDSDSVWAGTEGGLAVGSRHDIRLLKGPDGWESYFPTQMAAVPEDRINGLINLEDTLYLGTTAGFFRFDRSTVPTMVDLDLFGDPWIYNLSVVDDSILINSARGSALYSGGVFRGITTQGMPITNTSAGAKDQNGRYWDGNLFYGIYYQQDSEMISFNAGGTPANDCRGIIAAQGKLWGGFGNLALAYNEHGSWTVVPGVSGLYRDLEVGPLGELWVGTHGNGAFRILGDSIAHFNNSNSALSDIDGDPNTVVVPDIHFSGDAVWFANWKGQDGELVVVNPYDLEQWHSYTFVGGKNADQIVTVASGQGVVYAGSEQSGIYAIAYAGTPFFESDDFSWTFTSSNSGIGSDFVNVLKVDGYDTLWVGTAYGLSYQSLGEIYFSNIALPIEFGPAVTTIAHDSQGWLYAGSGRGLAIRDIATGSVECLTTRNSDLVDDDISDIFYESGTDALWISTMGGVSRLQITYRLATQDIDDVLAYPNPFVIRFGSETVRFNYSGLAEIRIFTVAGELVKEIRVNGEWDGRNAAGDPVASGVYLFTLRTMDDEVGRGKILLIRD